jgi:hypothetical protein
MESMIDGDLKKICLLVKGVHIGTKHEFYLRVPFAAVCPVIAQWNGYTIESGGTMLQSRLYGRRLLYSCKGVYDRAAAAAFSKSEGAVRYSFIDSDRGVKTAYCIDGQWTPPIVPCIGESDMLQRMH